jgi:hypothetical protein
MISIHDVQRFPFWGYCGSVDAIFSVHFEFAKINTFGPAIAFFVCCGLSNCTVICEFQGKVLATPHFLNSVAQHTENLDVVDITQQRTPLESFNWC